MNLLLYLFIFLSSLPEIMNVLNIFAGYLVLKLTSIIMSSFSFLWTKIIPSDTVDTNQEAYLGIQITSSLSSVAKINYGGIIYY